jgi:hypothetical protein
MKIKYSMVVFSMVLLILQGCSSIELTQSRYGNGLGISITKNSAQEEEKAEHFRNRKHDEVNDKRYAVNPISRKLTPLKTAEERSQETIEADKSIVVVAENEIVANEKFQVNHNILSTPIPQKENTSSSSYPSIQSETIPAETAKTQGDLTSLGYLGAVLVVAGLIFILLGIGGGYSIIVLGVVLIILAYFIG